MTASSHPLPENTWAELRALSYFEGLDDAAWQELASELQLVQLAQGQPLFQSGDPGDAAYFVLRGVLEVCLDGGRRLDVLDAGAMVGEMALITGQPRSATVSALGESELARLTRPAFERLAHFPQVREQLLGVILPRVQRTQLAAALFNLFGALDTRLVHEIQRGAAWLHLPAGEVLLRKGDPGDALYLLINGRLRMVADQPGPGEVVIGDVGRGETVGEFALLTGEPRSATVYALRDSDLVCLPRAVADPLLAAHPAALLQITRAIIRRSRRAPDRWAAARAGCTVLAVVPATAGAPLDGVVERLAAALQAFGKVLPLNSQRFEALFGQPGAAQFAADHPAHAVIDSWLTGIEQEYDYVLVEADPQPSAWTQRCLRIADRILLVADAAGQPDAALDGPAYQAALGRLAPDLVLVQPASTARPSRSDRWLDKYSPRTLQHTRLAVPADFARLARRLTGRAVGLVLSGGGARGFAHLGVIRALQEAGLEADLIGGTSMGALIGAVYAMDMDYAGMLQMAQAFASRKTLLDFTLPYTSLIASHKISRVLQGLFGETQVENLWRSYFCVSTNLSRAEPLVHTRGDLWRAVRASVAIPGIFAPLLQEGDLLVDGGVMNNFPVDLMRERCEGGFVIGSNASPKQEKHRAYAFGPGLSGWQVLWSKINPLAPKVRAPSILSSLMRASEASSIYRNTFQRQQVDLLVQPPVAEFASLDFGEYAQIIERGYQAALPLVAEFKK